MSLFIFTHFLMRGYFATKHYLIGIYMENNDTTSELEIYLLVILSKLTLNV